MEILNLLEERVSRLIQELEKAREENRRILHEGTTLDAELVSLREENQTLKNSLAQEKQVKEDVLQRVDALLERLKSLD